MAGNGNPVRRLFSLPRAPVDQVEVQDSTWDEWESVVKAQEEGAAAGQRRSAADKPARGGPDAPERSRR